MFFGCSKLFARISAAERSETGIRIDVARRMVEIVSDRIREEEENIRGELVMMKEMMLVLILKSV